MSSDWNVVKQEFGMEEFADSLMEVRRELEERLKTRENRLDRDMVNLIDAMQRLDMPPPHALTAATWIGIAIDAPATGELLMTLVKGLTKTLGEEVAQGTRDPKTLQPVEEATSGRRGPLN